MEEDQEASENTAAVKHEQHQHESGVASGGACKSVPGASFQGPGVGGAGVLLVEGGGFHPPGAGAARGWPSHDGAQGRGEAEQRHDGPPVWREGANQLTHHSRAGSPANSLQVDGQPQG